MQIRFLSIIPVFTLVVVTGGLLTACEGYQKTRILEQEGQYWQRVNTSSAIHLRGPKAQQRLNSHITECVIGVKELKRLGAIGEAVPAKEKTSEAWEKLSEFETPDRIGFERREFLEYHDFESCMISKGWERIEYVPYDVADRALDTFTRTHALFRESDNPKERDPVKASEFND